jgi:Dolichyl-phosphate-mannose-protein mannosyltransferase
MAKRKRPTPAVRATGRSSARPTVRPTSAIKPGPRFSRSTVAILLSAVILAAIPFAYGKYLEFNTNGAFDGGLNVYSAQSIVNGQKLHVEVFPSARPATLLVNVVGVALFGYSEFGPKLIQMLMQLTGLGLMFYTLRKLYGNLPAAVALVLTAFYLSCPPFAKFGNVKEQFMVACMLVAACAFILRYVNGRSWYLLIAGAAAINTYYFKPTGFSIVLAIGLWLFAQPLLRRYHWRHTVRDFLWLFFGAGLGLVPLALFYAWQGRLSSFLHRSPASTVVMVLEIYVIFLVARFILRNINWRKVRLRVRLRLVLVLLGVTVLVFVLTSLYVALFFREKGQLVPWLKDIPLIYYANVALMRGRGVLNGLIKLAAISGEYITGSREATVFRSQYDWVIGYYNYLLVPIGLGVLAVLWRLYRVAVSAIRSKDNLQQIDVAERFVSLMALWWFMDMLFIWISPRSYVEYFLPLTASASMLGAYVVYRCRKNPVGLLWLPAVWLAVNVIFTWIIPAEHSPYIALRTAETAGKYWGQFIIKCLLMAPAIAAYLLTKKKTLQPIRWAVLVLLCGVMFFWWNGDNLKKFEDKVVALRQARRQGTISHWEWVAHYIRDNSSPDDGLYVWGWYPGIYVQAGRSCPATYPAYSNMHSDNPEVVRRKIDKLVSQLRADPPLFIVDSRKIHFPFYKHPVFDLWPQWRNEKKGVFHFLFHSGQPITHKYFLTPDEWQKFRKLNLSQVEQSSFLLLTDRNHTGGPLPADKARELARRENHRHEAMFPLREFVMNNYNLLPLRTNMFVFKYKK